MGFEGGRALQILALVITLLDVFRHVAAGSHMGGLTAERAAHHDSNPRAFRSDSRWRIFACQT
ncbi:hypothetical protein DT73_03790 [Mangrovibacter sp. MFB070]|nr:hypothetical protein DT73_03790 [Mangrovibacter sp. MFB070]